MNDPNTLYRLYATDVLRMCHFYLGDRQRAEDVCQDVFVKLIRQRPALEDGKEKAWLLKVAMNGCRDLWRGAWLKRVTLGDESMQAIAAPDNREARSEARELMDAIRRLPPDFRETVLLYYYQNYGIAEIADMLHLSQGTVSSRLSRARDKLKTILEAQAEHDRAAWLEKEAGA